LQQLHGHHGKAQAQDHCGDQAVEDRPASLFGRQAGGSEADSDSVVPSQGEVDHAPQGGDAWINNRSVRNSLSEVYKVMGYCPQVRSSTRPHATLLTLNMQFDALWPDVTAREHLATYGRIKGYSGDRLKGEVDSMLKKMSLENYADKLAGDFSGGNKRKLSVAIALLADPKVVYLDEPSTGMDPASRRFMWSIIAESMQSRAVVLTTHSMEEADALCTRIGIMVNGKMQCLGSSQHLKSKFGKGCVVQMRVPPELEQAAVEFVCRNFAGAVLKQNYR
jgi:ABC-type multidrug transport system ATPase subunit